MDSFCKLIWSALVGLFRSRASLQAENLVLRHQLNVLRRKSPRRITSSAIDRLLFVGLYTLVPSVLDALQIVKPDTVIRWHRAGFRAYWRWKSGSRGGRPGTPTEIRQLIRQMSIANPSGVRPVSMVNCSSSGSMSATAPGGQRGLDHEPLAAYIGDVRGGICETNRKSCKTSTKTKVISIA